MESAVSQRVRLVGGAVGTLLLLALGADLVLLVRVGRVLLLGRRVAADGRELLVAVAQRVARQRNADCVFELAVALAHRVQARPPRDVLFRDLLRLVWLEVRIGLHAGSVDPSGPWQPADYPTGPTGGRKGGTTEAG